MNDKEPTAEAKMSRAVACILVLFGIAGVVALALIYLIATWSVT